MADRPEDRKENVMSKGAMITRTIATTDPAAKIEVSIQASPIQWTIDPQDWDGSLHEGDVVPVTTTWNASQGIEFATLDEKDGQFLIHWNAFPGGFPQSGLFGSVEARQWFIAYQLEVERKCAIKIDFDATLAKWFVEFTTGSRYDDSPADE
jgi:hypothetical protein